MNRINRAAPLTLLLLCVIHISFVPPAAAEDVYLGLRRSGFRPIPVGVPAFLGEAEAPAELVGGLRQVLLADLDFSVLVEPISDPRSRPRGRFGATVEELRRRLSGRDQEEGAAAPQGGSAEADSALWIERSELLRRTIPFPVIWEEVGVGVALSLRLAAVKEGVEAVWEVNFVAGGTPLAAGRLKLLPGNVRDAAHEIADAAVLAAAGEPGIAQSRVAFAQAGEGRNRHIVVADYDGERPQSVGPLEGESLMPAFFPDNKRLACIRYGELGPDLVVFRLPPEAPAMVLLSARSGLESTPEVSPDGQEIVFTLNTAGNADLYAVPAGGGELRRLTHSPGIDTSPAWSPTGSQLVFTSDRSGSPSLYVMGKTGLAQRNLMVQPGYLDAATWSPRGDRIAFVARSEGRFHVFTIDPLGGAAQRVSDRGNNESPCWSPDGLHLVFSSDRSGVSEIYTMRLDGSAVRRIPGTRGAITPTWSRPTKSQS